VRNGFDLTCARLTWVLCCHSLLPSIALIMDETCRVIALLVSGGKMVMESESASCDKSSPACLRNPSIACRVV
jgi:hypothetical protein